VGWTGFALPRLQARHSPMIASIILWVLWIGWHLPMQLAGEWTGSPNELVHALLGSFSARFIFTWLYNGSKGGLWTAVLLHASANVTSEFMPVAWAWPLVEGALAGVLIIGARMWRRPPAEGGVALGRVETVVSSR
jgi:CAAX protease family protein